MTLIELQDRYIQSVLETQPRYRAIVRGTAAGRLRRGLVALGFNWNQIQHALDDARDMADLELLAREGR
jgi:hypothetical protein